MATAQDKPTIVIDSTVDAGETQTAVSTRELFGMTGKASFFTRSAYSRGRVDGEVATDDDDDDDAADSIRASLGLSIERGPDHSERGASMVYADILEESNDEDDSIQVAKDVRLSRFDHDALVYHVRTLLDNCDNMVRGQLHRRMARINSAFQARSGSGLECADASQARANSPANNNNEYLTLPIVNAKVMDAATVLSNIIFPPTNMYSAIARKDKAAAAKACTEELNRHAATFGHFTHSFRAVLNAVRYNIAAIKVDWTKVEGQMARPSQDGTQVEFASGILMQGNSLQSLDPYNLFWDPHVGNMTQLARQGEFVAHAERVSLFDLRRKIMDGIWFGSTALSRKQKAGTVYTTSYPGYYYKTPNWDIDWWEKRNGLGVQCGGGENSGGMDDTGAGSDSVNWSSIAGDASAAIHGAVKPGKLNVYGACEVVELFVRLVGSDWGLKGSASEKLAVWRVVLLNGKRIVLCEPEKSPHGLLPVQIAMLSQDDNSYLREKSLAELLIPFQEHMNDIINKMQLTLKKGVAGGLTFYNAKHVQLDAMKNPVSGYVPVVNLPEDKTISQMVHQITSMPDTNYSMQHVSDLSRMLESIVPTQQAQQVADLQRATEFQAAATVAASAKRHLTLAKLLDDQLFSPVRKMQLSNTLAGTEVIEIIDEAGQPQLITPSVLLEAKLEFDISSGLLGMDRLILSSRIFQVLNLIVQGNMASSVDFLGMIDYWTTMIGDKTDFRMFKVQSPIDGLPPEQKQMAYELLVQATQGQGTGGNAGRGTVAAPAGGAAE